MSNQMMRDVANGVLLMVADIEDGDTVPLDEVVQQMRRAAEVMNAAPDVVGVPQTMDSAPRDGRWLLGFSRGAGDVPTVFPMQAVGDAWSDGDWRRHPHFWMPMPELPPVKA